MLGTNAIKLYAASVLVLLLHIPGAMAPGAHMMTARSTQPCSGKELLGFGPFLIDGALYTVTMEFVSVGAARPEVVGMHSESPDRTLTYAYIKDESDKKVWERTFDVQEIAGELRIYGTAYEVQGETGAGIVLEFGKAHPNRVTAGWFTVLAPRHGRLEVIAPEVRYFGMLEHIPDAGPDRRRLVANDLIRYQFWVGNYYLLRGVRVDFKAGTVVPLCIHNCALPVICQTDRRETDITLELFDSPTGNRHALLVRQQSNIECVDAYVEDVSAIDTDVSNGRPQSWLHVRIGTTEGWLSDTTEIQKLGLSRIERADKL